MCCQRIRRRRNAEVLFCAFLVKIKENLNRPISTFQTMSLRCKWFCAERSRHPCVLRFSCALFLQPKSEFMSLCALELLKRSVTLENRGSVVLQSTRRDATFQRVSCVSQLTLPRAERLTWKLLTARRTRTLTDNPHWFCFFGFFLTVFPAMCTWNINPTLKHIDLLPSKYVNQHYIGRLSDIMLSLSDISSLKKQKHRTLS